MKWKSIKVPDFSYNEFRILAANNKKKLGEMFVELIKTYKEYGNK